MKVLFVTNNNYPNSGTTTNIFNSLFFEGGLIDKIEQLDVLAGKDRYSDLDYEEYNGIRIYRTYAWTILPMGELKQIVFKKPVEAILGLIQKVAYHIELKINKTNFIDRHATKAFYRALKKINAKDYDAIVTISARYYQTAAVLKYCKETQKKFVFYQVDPCGTNQGMSDASRKDRERFEEELYSEATAVITTPIIFNEHKNNMKKELLEKVTGMEFPLVKNPNKYGYTESTEERLPKCMFLGSIYGGIRDPKYTLKLFQNMVMNNAIELHFIGVNKEELPDEFRNMNVICHGRLPLEQSIMFMNEADVLINIGNSVDNQVPSKVFDYISMGKPIVNVCKSRKCATLPYLGRYTLALNLYEEDDILESQSKELERFISGEYKKRIAYTDIKNTFRECTSVYCAEQMCEVLTSVI